MSFIQQTETYYHHKREHADFKRSESVFKHEWLYDDSDLSYLMSHFQEEDIAISILAQMGGVEGLTYALRTNAVSGLGADEINHEDALEFRREKFGRNEIAQQDAEPFWKLCWDELEDPMLRVLIVAGCVSLIIGAVYHAEDLGWIEGLAILLAVCIVVFVGGFNNFQKEKQFRSMEEESKKKNTILLRDGEEKKVPFHDVVVGDLIVLRHGYTIPCDGVYVLGTENLKSEEAGLTGEAKELQKNRFHPLLMKGTNIISGEGLMIAIAVGDHTEWGQLMAKLQTERENTPLQDKLDKLGAQIGWVGTAVAIALFVILTIIWAVNGAEDPEEAIVSFFIIAVTIVVVAVPEGLPLAVTISLAYSMKKMLLDNNFVRHLAACETMGNATTICSDKTGTLTTNKMSVSKCHMFGNTQFFEKLPTKEDMCDESYNRLCIAVCTNTKSFQDDPKNETERKQIADGLIKPKLTGGNQTDCAMLQWVIDLGASDYKNIRESNPVTKFFPFDSKVKRSSVLCRDGTNSDHFTMYLKGAAEQVLALCNRVLRSTGEVETLNEEGKREILDSMGFMTRTGLRCLGTCYRTYNISEIPFKSVVSFKLDDDDANVLFEDMVWICVTGIADPVRAEVPKAVETCHDAGIVVRMVTGDHLETAKHIAKQCGILTCSDHICMTGAEFRDLSEADKKEKLPRLRVLARSRPADKEALVSWYKEVNNDIVAVTGDGANDALALKNADVGLSMGIQGTDVAKEASDVIIMDDNFASIEKTVMWGRSVYDNIRKFVQFQLTVNVTALTISLVGAFHPPWQNPLTAVQLLWVNLIMDTMAALALATEDPSRKLLERHPFDRDSHLITKVLWRFTFGHSFYQLCVLIITMVIAVDVLDIDTSDNDKDTDQNPYHLTVIFNTFVWMQIFNEFNARRVNNEINVFENIFGNKVFWVVIAITVIAQVLLVQVAVIGLFASTVPLNGKEWAWCLGFGVGELLWHQVVRIIPIDLQDGIKVVDSETLFKKEKEFKSGYDSNNNDDRQALEVKVMTDQNQLLT